MKSRANRLRHLRRCEAGATAVEFAIVSWMLILVSLGIVEFGRALLVRNELSYAADLATRKILIDSAASDGVLEAEVRSALTSGDPELLQVTTGTETVDSLSFRTLTISYPFSPLVPGLTTDAINFSVGRRVPLISY